MKTKLIGLIRFLLTVALLAPVYYETGPFTVAVLALITITLELMGYIFKLHNTALSNLTDLQREQFNNELSKQKKSRPIH